MDKKTFLQQVEQALKNDLPGIKAHQLMSPLNRPLDVDSIPNLESYKHSSVAILFFENGQSIDFILIQRPEYEGNHSGQISFPGGKSEITDINEEFTARRETFEEIGVPLTEHLMIGQLSDVFIPVSKFIVRPFMYWLDETPSFVPDAREVAEIFTVPLLHLLEESKVKRTTLRLGNGILMKNVPYFDFNDKIVWGATALVLSELKEILRT